MDLSPAKWIWLPSERTLACTFVLFRREVALGAVPEVAKGWIAADSRYRLTVNGQRVQWGPAPFDPRHAEADPADLAPYLREGKNCIGVEVLYYGHGDGTWPFGKPGLLMKLEIDGEAVVTDAEWRCVVDRAHPPGQYARWFLRALQEEFDARRHPFGWDLPGFDDSGWLAAQELRVPPSRAVYSGGYKDYVNEIWDLHPERSTLIERTIPMLNEEWIPATARWVNEITWHRNPRDWFENRTPGSFEAGESLPVSVAFEEVQGLMGEESLAVSGHSDTDRTNLAGAVSSEASIRLAVGSKFVTYELDEEVVGWPGFAIDAPEGTVVEMMVQESHNHEKTPWLDSHIYQWSRFICREGENRFETFDFEAGRWLQLHVREHTRAVTIRDVGIRRRIFPWPHQAEIEVGEPALQRLFYAAVNTINNSAQETIVDGMGRERQQYAGDGSHQLHAIRYAFGESRLPARFLRTFAQGQLLDGVFSDSWPAVDRLQRIWQRNMDASGWGPLVDHSVGFVFDHYHHWMQTGDLEPVRQNIDHLLKFAEYLEELHRRGLDGLLPVDRLRVNTVWIDHDAYRNQSQKVGAFNLYVAAMLEHALAPVLEALGGRESETGWARKRSAVIVEAVQRHFWDAEREVFVNNKLFEWNEDEPRSDDRTLATAVLYDYCPDSRTESCVEALATRPVWMGQSYPANIVWNYWALAKAGRIQPVIDDLRERWAPMRSVAEAKALQEFWKTTPDTTNLMSHCPVAPLTALYQGILGLWPTSPGFETMEIRPQLGDIEHLHVVARTPKGPVSMTATPREVRITVPWPTLILLPERSVHVRKGETFSFDR